VSVDQDKDVLAGEYVLGTLDSFARAEAQALLNLDPSFAAAVHAWERRLGELSAMISAVEPPAQAWNKIKEPVAREAAARRPAVSASSARPAAPVTTKPKLVVIEPPGAPAATAAPAAASAPAAPTPAGADAAAPTATFAPPEASGVSEAAVAPEAASAPEAAAASSEEQAAGIAPVAKGEAEVIQLSRRVNRWRASTGVFGLLAASLLALIVLREVKPESLPAPLRPTPVEVVKTVEVIKTVEVPAPAPAEFVAVLQKDAASPAFLLTFDFAKQTVLVRAVGAERQSGKSYELWLVSDKFPAPKSLGVIGEEPFTVRRALGDFDAVTINRATYAVSLEPQGGSPTGAPTGPVLYSGKLVQATPPGLVATP
jgi:anti-sigma-K factor RskA